MKRLLICLLLLWASAASGAEKPVTLKRDFGTLHGTLITPDAGAETVALIIAGSGPTDRNGNNPMGGMTNTYLQLAQALEKAGVASLRYDKRAIGSSRYDDPTQVSRVSFEEFIGDAAALADYLAQQGFRKVVLVGHSEGALIALCAAQQSKAVSGVVSLAGPGYPLDEILQIQLAAQLAAGHLELLMEATGIIAQLKRGEKVDMAYHTQGLQMLFNPDVQPFLISVFRYDPKLEIRKVQLPVLIVNGDNDLQVSADNAEALHKANPAAKKIIIKDMTHTLKSSTGRTLPDQQAAYGDASLPLDEQLIVAVTQFALGL